MSTDPTEIVYDALNFDGLERRANYRTVAYRIDMLHIFDRKDAAATLYEIIYRWQFEVKRTEVLREIDRRKKAGLTPLAPEEVESMMWVYMSYNDFVRETGGAIGYNTVIRLIDYLVHDVKSIEQRENTDSRYADFMYRINKEVVRPLLKALPTEPLFAPKVPKKKSKSTQMGTPDNDSTQMGTPDNPPLDSTQMGTGLYPNGYTDSTQMGTEVYPFGGTSHTTHILPTHTSSQTGDGDFVDTQSPSPLALFAHPEFSFLAFDDLQHPTFMEITFIDDERAEITNKGYDRIAQDVVADLAARGVKLEVRPIYRKSGQVIDFEQAGKRITDGKLKAVSGTSGESWLEGVPQITALESDVDDALEWQNTPTQPRIPTVKPASQPVAPVPTGSTNQQGDTHELSNNPHPLRDTRHPDNTNPALADDRQRVETTDDRGDNASQDSSTATTGRNDAHAVPGEKGDTDGHRRGIAQTPPPGSVDPVLAGEQAQGGATGNPGVESRAPEVYATIEAWDMARDAYAEGLRAVWDSADVALRKQYASRFPTYRGAQLRAWESQHAKPAKRQPGVPDKPTLTPNGRILYEAWCSLFHVAIPEHPSIVTTANELYQPISRWADRLHWTQADVLKDIMNRAYENDKERGYYKGRGVKLFNIKHEIEGWQSAMERKLQATRSNGTNGRAYTPVLDREALRREPV